MTGPHDPGDRLPRAAARAEEPGARQPGSSAALANIRAFRPFGTDVGTAGQPAPAEFEAIRDAGFSAVINLALPTSDNALDDEGRLVTALGMAYVHLPVKFDAPKPADFAAFRGVMAAFADRAVFVHCALNYRVSAFMFLHRVLDRGVPVAEAERDLLAVWTPDAVWGAFIDGELRRRAD